MLLLRVHPPQEQRRVRNLRLEALLQQVHPPLAARLLPPMPEVQLLLPVAQHLP